MMVGNVNNDMPQQYNPSNEIQQIEKQIRSLQEQLKRIKQDKTASPDEKQKKIKELEDKIAQLEKLKTQVAQKARRNEPKESTPSEQEEEKSGMRSRHFEKWI